MNTATSARRTAARGYTLIELLVVISVIALLASLLLPAIKRAREKALIQRARKEIMDIRNAVTSYLSDYNGRMPLSAGASGAIAALNPQPDFTYNDASVPPPATPLAVPHPAYVRDNSELVAILADLEQYRNGANTVNLNHARNPRRNPYLNFKDSGGTSTAPEPGVGVDGVYRDPWGNPYFITVDANYDNVCHDPLYRLAAVSGGGLVGTAASGTGPNNWAVRGEVMIWSSGPDGGYSTTVPANQGVNRDNILSWWDRK